MIYTDSISGVVKTHHSQFEYHEIMVQLYFMIKNLGIKRQSQPDRLTMEAPNMGTLTVQFNDVNQGPELWTLMLPRELQWLLVVQ